MKIRTPFGNSLVGELNIEGSVLLPHEIAAVLGTKHPMQSQPVDPPPIIMRAQPAQTNSPKTTADIIRALVAVRDERRKIAKHDKELIAQEDELKGQLLAKMREQGDDINAISSRTHTATKTSEIVPVVDDWDQFFEWLWETKSWHMVQRRIAVKAFREVIESGDAIPGLHPTEKIDISLTAR